MGASAGSSIALPSFISFAKNQTGGTASSLTINKPGGTVENDLMVMIIASTSTITWTQVAGWTEIFDVGGLVAAYKVAGASEAASYTPSATSVANHSGIIVTYRNAFFDIAGSPSAATSSNTQIANAISLTRSGSTLLAFFTARTSSSCTYSTPTTGLGVVNADSDGIAPSWALYSQDNVASGTTGSKTALASFTPSDPFSVLIGITPA